jgi:hypothetical protein
VGLARAAQVESIPARDTIETSAVVEVRKASPFARKIAPFRLDRDIVEDQIRFLARAVYASEKHGRIRLFDSPYFLNRLGIAFA